MKIGIDDIVCVVMFVVNLAIGLYWLTNSTDTYGSATCIVCGIVCLIPFILKHTKTVRLNMIFIVTIAAALSLRSLGVLFSGYDVFDNYDLVTHTFSSMLVSLCVWMTLCCYSVHSPTSEFTGKAMFTMIMLIMATFSVYWETFEYFLDTAWGTHSQYSPFDTVKDMVFNMTGSLITALYSYYVLKKMTMRELVDSFELSPKLVHFIDHKG